MNLGKCQLNGLRFFRAHSSNLLSFYLTRNSIELIRMIPAPHDVSDNRNVLNFSRRFGMKSLNSTVLQSRKKVSQKKADDMKVITLMANTTTSSSTTTKNALLAECHNS